MKFIFKITLLIILPLVISTSSLCKSQRAQPKSGPDLSGSDSNPSSDEPGPSHDQNESTNYNSDSSPDSDRDTNPFLLPPSSLEAVRINDTSIVLRWELPYYSVEHLQFYKIQYKSSKRNSVWKTDPHEIPPIARAHQIYGLRPGSYFFVVSAVYNNDDNRPSSQFKYKLIAKSKIPADKFPEQKAPQIYWHETETDYFRFKWKYDVKEQDIPNYGFLVYYRSAHAVTDFVIHNTLEESVEIAELEPETPYEAKVIAYNDVGVSEFSDIISIKTKPRANLTTTTATSTTTTPSPPEASTISSFSTLTPSGSDLSSTISPVKDIDRSFSVNSNTSTTRDETIGDKYSRIDTTLSIHRPITPVKPLITQTQTQTNLDSYKPITERTSNHTGLDSISSSIDLILWGQDEKSVVLRYVLYVLIILLFLTTIVLCWIGCQQRKQTSSPPSSTNESMQFDVEINCYFKNSFPGVDTDDYLSNGTQYSSQHCFINNHPNIEEFK